MRRGGGCIRSDFGRLAHEPVDDVGRHTQVVQVDNLSGAQGVGFPNVDDVFADHPFIEATSGQLLVGWSVGRSVGRLIGWSVGRLVGWLVGWSVGWLVG